MDSVLTSLRRGCAVFATFALASAAHAQTNVPVLNVSSPAPTGSPILWTPDGAPVVGSAFSVEVRDAAPGATGALMVGALAGSAPLPSAFASLSSLPIVVGGDGVSNALLAMERVPASLVGVDLELRAVFAFGPAMQFSNTLRIRPGSSTGLAFASGASAAVEKSPRGVEAGDFDLDGDIDLAVANTSSHNVTIVLRENGLPVSTIEYRVGKCPGEVRAADLNGDGVLDLVTVDSGSDNVTTLLGNGDGTFGAPLRGPGTPGPRGLTLGDFDRDGRVDAAVCNFSDDQITILFGFGDGTFRRKHSFPIVDGPFHQESADMNGDGYLDLVVAGRNTDDVQIVLGNGDGTFALPIVYYTGDRPRNVAVGDVDGDGVLDVAIANWFDDYVTVMRGNGDGTMVLSQDVRTAHRPTKVSLADCDGDGNLDMLVATNLLAVSVASGRGDGTFGEFEDVPTGFRSDPNDLLVRDVDFDGTPDLIMSYGESGPGGCPTGISTNGAVIVRTNLLGEL